MSFKKFAFTLAEVLITLGIIGVIAALTVPTLVSKYKEKVTVTKLKKVNSILNNAMLSAINEYGTIDNWGITSSNAGPNEEGKTILDSSSMEIIGTRLGKYIKHRRLDPNWGDGIKETNMQQTVIESKYAQFDRPVALALEDGSVIMIALTSSSEACRESSLSSKKICSSAVVWFPDKTKKRIEGVNQFSFYIMKDRIIPWGVQEDIQNPFNNYCKISKNIRQSGRGCTAWVIYNENMDYLHCDDLSWNGKKKCK